MSIYINPSIIYLQKFYTLNQSVYTVTVTVSIIYPIASSYIYIMSINNKVQRMYVI